MEVQIISNEEAVKLGLTQKPTGAAAEAGDFMYGVVGKVSAPAAPGEAPQRKKEDIVELFRVHKKTGRREIISETPEYRKFKKDLKINQDAKPKPI